MIELDAVQARVIAALVEKSITTPQYYPLTINALTGACNQKSCRDPVMKLSEGEVGSALIDLEDMSLAAREEAGGRSVKWRHRFQHQLMLNRETLALLVTLILRGPQTVSELRSNASALGGPTDPAAVHEALEDLEDRAQPLVRLLARQAGQKEGRYAQLLSGEPAPIAPAQQRAEPAAPAAGLAARVDELEHRIAALEARLGGDPDPD